jgi:hypothetical protein
MWAARCTKTVLPVYVGIAGSSLRFRLERVPPFPNGDVTTKPIATSQLTSDEGRAGAPLDPKGDRARVSLTAPPPRRYLLCCVVGYDGSSIGETALHFAWHIDTSAVSCALPICRRPHRCLHRFPAPRTSIV